jgi:membrane protease YdiL (CAAX protease family)
LLYWPLGHAWPDTFGRAHLEKPARDLWSGAHGIGVVAIVVVAAVGAPLVEELMYRGMLQGAFVRCTGGVSGVLIVGLWFATIHFQPAQLPGLLLVGVVLGVATVRTGRLGMAVLIHMAFNATGLVLVAR